jgi:phosphate acetyltransferase
MDAVARSVYVAGLGPGSGKSIVALGVAELLSRQVGRIGVFQPMAGDGVATLLRERYQVPPDGFGVTGREAADLLAHGQREELFGRIIERYRAYERLTPATVVIGSDADDADDPRRLGFDARLAVEFGSVVVAVVDAQRADTVATAYHSLVDLGATVVAVVANRAPDGVTLPDLPVPAYFIPETPAVSAPTVAEMADALDGLRIAGDDATFDRDVLHTVVGGAHVPAFLSHLVDGALVITPGDRADLVVATSAAHAAGDVSVAGIAFTLGEAPPPEVLELVERLTPALPMFVVGDDSYAAAVHAGQVRANPDAFYPRKVEAALGAFESNVDTADLGRRLEVTRSSRVTPLMFEYDLIDRARAQRKRLVLPEGTEERILRATEILLRRGVADLTLLGHPDEIARRARELGLDVAAADFVDPGGSQWREEFAVEYAELRRHKGVPLDRARDIVREPTYFGTMMVHTGRCDGMVSGATHTTAATIRPAFEIIKTVPGVSIASSVFFMLLADRVLVYGDCAVNPDPNATELADIALSSADTAAAFGIEPRVAMLSYSTGTSGSGADVDKVAAATALVRERRPDLPVEGPIQYDAAIDPQVAITKLPDSAVAGKATVFVFPDLNTGNNTYKAVQRSAGAVAVGPVMQGLRRPVNDLSRGATVKDIVNTVAITAIQAASA